MAGHVWTVAAQTSTSERVGRKEQIAPPLLPNRSNPTAPGQQMLSATLRSRKQRKVNINAAPGTDVLSMINQTVGKSIGLCKDCGSCFFFCMV